MECVAAFFVVLTLLLVASGSLLRYRSRHRRRRQGYQAVAKRFTGRYQPAGLFRRPAVWTRYGTTTAVLRESRTRWPYRELCTQVSLPFPDEQLSFDVMPKAAAEDAAPLRGLQRTQVGETDFQNATYVRSSDPPAATRYFSEAVCWQVQRLGRLGEPQFYLRLHRGRLLIQKPARIYDFTSLEQLMLVSFDLYDQLMLTRAEGIEFDVGNVLPTLANPICPICGEVITDDLVFCSRCKTPHHGDCWGYTGCCSVFGCQQADYQRPQTGTPKNA